MCTRLVLWYARNYKKSIQPGINKTRYSTMTIYDLEFTPIFRYPTFCKVMNKTTHGYEFIPKNYPIKHQIDMFRKSCVLWRVFQICQTTMMCLTKVGRETSLLYCTLLERLDICKPNQLTRFWHLAKLLIKRYNKQWVYIIKRSVAQLQWLNRWKVFKFINK